VNSLPSCCDLNPGPTTPESSMLTTQILSYPIFRIDSECILDTYPGYRRTSLCTVMCENYTANYNIFPEHQLKSSISGSSFKFQEISRISRSCRDPVCLGLTWVSRYQKKHSPTCTHNEIEEGLTKPYSLCFYIYIILLHLFAFLLLRLLLVTKDLNIKRNPTKEIGLYVLHTGGGCSHMVAS